MDSTKFVKLFIRGVKALKELTGAGTKVFEVLYLTVQENIGKDRVLMSFAEVDQALTPMSESTFMRGMRELVEKKFIAATPTLGVYWLNPDFVWNGDRLAFVKEYRKNKSSLSAIQKPSICSSSRLRNDCEAFWMAHRVQAVHYSKNRL